MRFPSCSVFFDICGDKHKIKLTHEVLNFHQACKSNPYIKELDFQGF